MHASLYRPRVRYEQNKFFSPKVLERNPKLAQTGTHSDLERIQIRSLIKALTLKLIRVVNRGVKSH